MLARLQFDGACDNRSPRRLMGCGAVLHCAPESEELFSSPGSGSSNRAEYLALELGLRAFADHPRRSTFTHLHVEGDSQLVIHQMQGTWAVKDAELRTLHTVCSALVQALMLAGIKVTFGWIPRGRNTSADALSKTALEAYGQK